MEVMALIKRFMNAHKAFGTFVRFVVLGLRAESRSFHESSTADSVTWRLCIAVANVSQDLYIRTPCSKKILYIYHHWRMLLAKEFPEQYQNDEHTVPNRLMTDSSEECEICDSVIDFENCQWARCSSGHQFGRAKISFLIIQLIVLVRCGLSFLSIQAPKISKSCGLCNRQYLTDEHLLAMDRGSVSRVFQLPRDSSTTESSDQGIQNGSSVSLVQLLLNALDVCIYCGGKFVG